MTDTRTSSLLASFLSGVLFLFLAWGSSSCQGLFDDYVPVRQNLTYEGVGVSERPNTVRAHIAYETTFSYTNTTLLVGDDLPLRRYQGYSTVFESTKTTQPGFVIHNNHLFTSSAHAGYRRNRWVLGVTEVSAPTEELWRADMEGNYLTIMLGDNACHLTYLRVKRRFPEEKVKLSAKASAFVRMDMLALPSSVLSSRKSIEDLQISLKDIGELRAFAEERKLFFLSEDEEVLPSFEAKFNLRTLTGATIKTGRKKSFVAFRVSQEVDRARTDGVYHGIRFFPPDSLSSEIVSFTLSEQGKRFSLRTLVENRKEIFDNVEEVSLGFRQNMLTFRKKDEQSEESYEWLLVLLPQDEGIFFVAMKNLDRLFSPLAMDRDNIVFLGLVLRRPYG